MKRGILALICVVWVLNVGCAEIIRIPRYNGSFYELSGNKLGNKKITYSCELYESGKLKTEAYGYERDIATPLGNVLHGIAEAFGAAGNHLGI